MGVALAENLSRKGRAFGRDLPEPGLMCLRETAADHFICSEVRARLQQRFERRFKFRQGLAAG
jgi:hypothetical protein